jgi:hypothetical protein
MGARHFASAKEVPEYADENHPLLREQPEVWLVDH